MMTRTRFFAVTITCLVLALSGCGGSQPRVSREDAEVDLAKLERQAANELQRQAEADEFKVKMEVINQCKAKGRAMNYINGQIYCQDK
jgi:hypothetical protein